MVVFGLVPIAGEATLAAVLPYDDAAEVKALAYFEMAAAAADAVDEDVSFELLEES